MVKRSMAVEIVWRSERGTLTCDNRDCCGVGLRDESALAIVLDGSTSGANSGEFARAIARDLIDWFISSEQVTPQTVTDRLQEIHGDLSTNYRKDSASLVIALVESDGATQILHSGDCLAGTCQGPTDITWQAQPHTLANVTGDLSVADIAQTPVRHRLTRSFRSREFAAPDVSEIRLEEEQDLVLATDGFWAELSRDTQARFLEGDEVPDGNHQERDDCSALILRQVAGRANAVSGEAFGNLYIGDAEGS